MILARNNLKKIQELKEFFNGRSKLKDHGSLKYFLGIQVAHSKFLKTRAF